MDKNTLLVGVVIVLIAVAGFFVYKLYFPKTGYNTDSSTETNPLNVFEGKITNAKVSAGRFEGVTTYDASCIGSPITECDAGIKTSEYGTMNFHYSHNMATQPCLHMFGPEKVVVEILNSDGDARIIRTIDLSSMGGHHG